MPRSKTASGDLKERTLGVEVFGREPGYDTNADPVVRISAGEVRKRIAQYYHENGMLRGFRSSFRSAPMLPNSCCVRGTSPRSRRGLKSRSELCLKLLWACGGAALCRSFLCCWPYSSRAHPLPGTICGLRPDKMLRRSTSYGIQCFKPRGRSLSCWERLTLARCRRNPRKPPSMTA